MYTAKLSFKITNRRKTYIVLDLINTLLGCYRKNGQILGKEYPIAHSNSKNKIFAFVSLPDKNALQNIHNNKYVNNTTGVSP